MDDGEHRGRGVLEGAFRLLDALSRAPGGSGLSEVARATGLPKPTAYRLLEQLVALGAAQRHDQRYYVGPSLARLGRAWQPDPGLRQAALEPARELATLTRTTVAVTVLHDDRVRVVAGSRSGGTGLPRMRMEDVVPAATAAGRVLLAGTRGTHDEVVARVGGPWLARRHPDGVRCLAAPVWHADGAFAGSISAVVATPTAPAGLGELVLRASRRITRRLPVSERFVERDERFSR
ncbi:MAG TPA: helix-turn-helix domain-containing protein [Amycolatopsis sp.]|uniref:Helix-turn-helix domain-containing protein n=1 Tax=Amycolatopsis nalaikhensis TaxID=715472 RepID=A0ABY8XZB1_9PSEU|nr:helix-turn-helix domain-containing protein [Amycolatopsis sp. 2-2]WIV61080.1 helix-turn-helix domain-containing protein [Amycolatopsis sp. 2-2]